MASAIWKGSLTFGLVNVPVVLYSAESRDEVSFHMLDRRDQSRIVYRRINAKTGKEVEWDDIVKGYEFDKGKYVTLSAEDFQSAHLDSSESAEIVGFLDRSAIEPKYFERPYYLAPLKNGGKGYVLLREVLRKTETVAVAKIIFRTREYIAAVYDNEDGLILNTLRYGHELRSAADVGVPEGSPSTFGITAKEVALAEKLVEEMRTEWKPGKFRDQYAEKIEQLVETKLKKGKVKSAPETTPEKPKKGQVVDLMELLKRSVGKRGESTEKSGEKSTEKKKSRSPARKRAA